MGNCPKRGMGSWGCLLTIWPLFVGTAPATSCWEPQDKLPHPALMAPTTFGSHNGSYHCHQHQFSGQPKQAVTRPGFNLVNPQRHPWARRWYYICTGHSWVPWIQTATSSVEILGLLMLVIDASFSQEPIPYLSRSTEHLLQLMASTKTH